MNVAALQRMITSIARNTPAEPDAAERIAEHLTLFWTPAMVDELGAAVDAGAVVLDELPSNGLHLARARGVARGG